MDRRRWRAGLLRLRNQHMIDLDYAVIVDVEATTVIRQAEVTAAKRMIERSRERFGLYPARLAADSSHGSAPMLAWLVHEQGIKPHIPVFDKSQRKDGTFSRADFTFDVAGDWYICPGGKELVQFRRTYNTPRSGVDPEGFMRYRASKCACDACALKPQCCPNDPARKILRSIHEGARDMARDILATDEGRASRRQRKKIEMLFAHLKRILKLDRLRLRGPNGARDEFHLAATAQNLRKMAKILVRSTPQLACRRTTLPRRRCLSINSHPTPASRPSSSTESVHSGPCQLCLSLMACRLVTPSRMAM